MKHFVDGDQICVTRDDFVDLQESSAVFIPRESEAGRAIESGGLSNVAKDILEAIITLLDSGGGEYDQRE